VSFIQREAENFKPERLHRAASAQLIGNPDA
jgi:hypothetical protein